MSVAAIGAVFAHSTSSGTDLAALLSIADQVNDKQGGVSWASHAYTARRVNVHRDSVRAAMRRLVAKGELVVRQREHPDGGGSLTNTYALGPALACPSTCAGAPAHRLLDDAPSTQTRGVSPHTPLGAPTHPPGGVHTPAPRGARAPLTVTSQTSTTPVAADLTVTRARCATCSMTEERCRARSKTSGHDYEPAPFESHE